MQFNANVIESVVSNYYHLKPQTWYMSMKKFLIITTHYKSLKKGIEKCYLRVIFSETLTNTCEDKIKSFTIEQKHFNKLILYKWSIVQLVICNINGITSITMN